MLTTIILPFIVAAVFVLLALCCVLLAVSGSTGRQRSAMCACLLLSFLADTSLVLAFWLSDAVIGAKIIVLVSLAVMLPSLLCWYTKYRKAGITEKTEDPVSEEFDNFDESNDYYDD